MTSDLYTPQGHNWRVVFARARWARVQARRKGLRADDARAWPEWLRDLLDAQARALPW